MYDKTYYDHIALLRNRPARPPFTQTAQLIAQSTSRRTILPLFAKLATILIVAGSMATGYWLLSRNNDSIHSTSVLTQALPKAGDLPLSKSSEEKSLTETARKSSSRTMVSNLSNSQSQTHLPIVKANIEEKPAQEEISRDNGLIRNCSVPEQPIARLSAADTHSLPFIQNIDSTPSEKNYFFAVVGGAISQQLSSDAAFRTFSCTDAFVGAGYTLAEHSSLRVIAAEDVFVMPTTINTISYHDTAFIHNGQSYDNILGEVQTSSGATSTRIYSIGSSYRYTFGEDGSAVRPFGELFAGGSTKGLLSRGEVGVELAAWSRIQMDIQFIASALLPQNSSWLMKSSLAVSASYRW